MRRRNDTYDGLVGGLLAVLVFALVTGLCIALAVWANRAKCSGKWEGTYEHRYDLPGGCKVRINGQWLPDSVVRVGP